MRARQFAPGVRTEVRNHHGANLGCLPVEKCWGCQVVVSTLVSTVLPRLIGNRGATPAANDHMKAIIRSLLIQLR